MLFFSDKLRDMTWSKLYHCQKVKNYYIPRYLQTIDMEPRFQVFFEIVRQSLEVMMEYESGLHKTIRTGKPPETAKIGLSKIMHTFRPMLPEQHRADYCDLSVQSFLTDAFSSWRGPNGGYEHLVIKDVLQQLDINARTKMYTEFDYHRYVDTSKACAISLYLDHHVVSLIKCDGKWCFMDNESVGLDRCKDLKIHDRMKISDILSQIPNQYSHYGGSLFVYAEEENDILIRKAIRDDVGKTRYGNFVNRVPPQHRDQVIQYIEPMKSILFR